MPPSRQLASRFTQLCLTAALALVPTGASAAAQVITAVSPAQGSLGSVLAISGSGFGRGRPSATLVFASGAGGKPQRFRLPVQSYSDGEIRAVIDKALPGACTLCVQTAQAGQAVADFEVMPPQAGAVIPASAAPGDHVVIHGACLGSKALAVRFFERRATVLALQDESVTVVVPSGLPDGQWTPLVSNALGSDLADGALTITGSRAAVPADFVRAVVGGQRYLAQGSDLHASIVGPQIAFDASHAGSAVQQLSVLVPFNMASSPVPSLFSGSNVSSQPIVFLESSPANGSSSLWVAMPGLQPWQVAIVGRSGGHLAGRLDAVLVRLAGPGPDMLPISNGLFVVTPHP